MTVTTCRDTATPAEVDDLVTTHLALPQFAVSAVASRTSLPAYVNRDDLVSAAQMALLEAARRYDPEVGAAFPTYAMPRLQGAVLDELRAADWAPRSVRAKARRIEAATDRLLADLGRPPTVAEVAAHLDVDPSFVHSVTANVHRAVIVSADEAEVLDLSIGLAEEDASPEQSLLHRERRGYLFDAIDSLPDRIREVIERHFFDEETLTEIAADLQVTLSRVSQMRAQGLRLLHAALSEVVDGCPAPEVGGSRARLQQRQYVQRVASASPDYRMRLAPRAARPVLAAS